MAVIYFGFLSGQNVVDRISAIIEIRGTKAAIRKEYETAYREYCKEAGMEEREEDLNANFRHFLPNFIVMEQRQGKIDSIDTLNNKYGVIVELLHEMGGFNWERLASFYIYLGGARDIIDFDHVFEGEPNNTPVARGLRLLLMTLYTVAQEATPLLIVGETGTSKELVAQAVHHLSPGRKHDFTIIDCVGMPDELFESELYGHAKGAFTGASADRPGKLESAKGGTILLDEIGKISHKSQAKLLRVIQTGKYSRIGDSKMRSLDARFIATVQPGELDNLLSDLKYRLGYPDVIRLPNIEERMTLSARVVIGSALHEAQRIRGVRGYSLSKDALQFLKGKKYPGNFRELVNVLGYGIRHTHPNNPIIHSSAFFDLNLEDAAPAHPSATAKDELSKIPFHRIIEHAEEVGNALMTEKVRMETADGRSLRKAYLESGGEDYSNFQQKLKRRITLSK